MARGRQASGIDYSKWDAICEAAVESDDEPAQETVVVNVAGFGVSAHILNGTYVAMPQRNHHRFVFHKLLDESIHGIDKVVLYYWDDRDGIHMNGWWFGPAVGSNSVWAFNPGEVEQPPPIGWRVPWFCDVVPGARVLLRAGRGLEPPPVHCPEVPLVAVEEALGRTLQLLAKAGSALRCIECATSQPRKPVVLPCGHLVCFAHIEQAPSNYSCPWTVSCNTRRFPISAGTECWRMSNLAEQLLTAPGMPPSAPREAPFVHEPFKVQHPLAEVLKARTPRRLCDAYTHLGEARARQGRAAEAAVAFLAARTVFEEFEGSSISSEQAISEGIVQISSPVLQGYKNLRAIGTAWLVKAVRSGGVAGSAVSVEEALAALPQPDLAAAGEDSTDTIDSLASRWCASGQQEGALRSAAECPICFNIIFAPVTTPCGHSFCRRCLARTLDWERGCPLCRRAIEGHIGGYSVSEPLQKLLAAIWPELHRQRLEEDIAEQSDDQADWLPLFVPLLAFPLQAYAVHTAEPRYKLMVRRVLGSGRKAFGACLRTEPTSNGGQVFGTELVVDAARVLPDGASLLETVGHRRFRLLEVSTKDGYSIGRVEYLTDDEEAEAQRALDDLVVAVRACADRFIQPSPRALERVLAGSTWSTSGRSDADELAWASVQCLAIPPEIRAHFLSISSPAERLATLIQILRRFSGLAETAVT